MRMPFSIVIVTWQSARELDALLPSITHHLGSSAVEVVVVDNASTDGSADVAEAWEGPRTVVRLEDNRGFGVANNVGVRTAREEAVVLLNPDTLLVDASLERLAEAAVTSPALYGPELLNADRSRQPSASAPPAGWEVALRAVTTSRLLPSRLRVRCEPWRAGRTVEVGWLTGACIAAPRWALLELGPFDETIDLFGEDLDLSLRARLRGLRCFYAPDVARVVHLGGRSSAQRYADRAVDLKVRMRREVVARHLGRGRERYDFAAQMLFFAIRYAAKRLLRRDARRDYQWLDAARRARRRSEVAT